MIVVVADTSPLNNLVQIRAEHILPQLFGCLLIPAAVVQELGHPRAGSTVREWVARVPSWVVVREVTSEVDPSLTRLDPGERQAIQLAKQEHADLLLMDERLGVRIAREQGLAVTGTLGVLLQAGRRGLIDIERALRELQATDFRCTAPVIEEVLRRAKRRP